MAPKRKEPAAGDRARAKRRIEKEFLVHHLTPAYCFTVGSSDFGALGLGEDVTDKYRAAHVDVDGKKLVSVVCGGMHTVALAEDGTVYTWGVNDEGALGRPTSGTAWEKEPNSMKEDCYVPGRARMPDGVFVVQVAAGDGFTFALSDEGAIYGWGQFKDDVSSFNNFSPSVQLQRLPTEFYQPADIRDRVRKLAAGARHMAALTRRGEVLTWGLGGQGQLGRLEPFDNEHFPSKQELLTPKPVELAKVIGTEVVDIGTGNYTTFAINKRGGVAAWGLNNGGQLGLPVAEPEEQQDEEQEAADGQAANGPTTAGEQDSDGQEGEKKRAVEHRVWHPTAVPALSKGIIAVAGGEHHSLALTKQHTVLSFGATTYGMLGRMDVPQPQDKETLEVPEPTAVDSTDGLADEVPVSIAAGVHVSACVTAGGNLFTWGSNTSFQLAKGQVEEDSLVPTRMRRHKAFGNRKVLQFSFGGQHAALLATEDPDSPPAAAAAAPAAARGAGTSAAAEAAQAVAAAAEPEAAEAAADMEEGAGESEVPAPAAPKGKRVKKEPMAKAPAAKRTRRG
eukprot:GHUV01019101.1.p1 GENE.GHUV01019101.1~~GHUV01019101.1.p1  ORF type:complete len:563 (+),score=199.22 GHUV01019101.1:126-1814(+)